MYEQTDTQYTADQIYRRELRQIEALSEQEENTIYERIRNGDTDARRELVTPNLPFAAAYVKRFIGSGVDYEDLRQLAAIGLMEAAEKFDPDEGASFRTFAVYHIKAAVIRGIEMQGRTVRIPSHLMHAALKYRRFVSEFQKNCGREPSDFELEIYLGFSHSDIAAIRKDTQPVVSLDQPIGEEDEDLTLGDTIEAGEDIADTIADEDERQNLHNDMERLLDELPSEERDALRMHYYQRLTHAQIAARMGVSASQPRNIINKGLRDLRKADARRVLRPYVGEYIDRYAYKSSFASWQESGSSSTERTVLKLLEFEERPR